MHYYLVESFSIQKDAAHAKCNIFRAYYISNVPNRSLTKSRLASICRKKKHTAKSPIIFWGTSKTTYICVHACNTDYLNIKTTNMELSKWKGKRDTKQWHL